MISKGDRVAYTVLYHRGSTGPGSWDILRRTEYGIVTSTRDSLSGREKARIRVEDPKSGATKYVERFTDDVTLAPAEDRRKFILRMAILAADEPTEFHGTDDLLSRTVQYAGSATPEVTRREVETVLQMTVREILDGS
jgi:hypothetical protein